MRPITGNTDLRVFHVRDSERPMWVVAKDWVAALTAWKAHVAVENDCQPEDLDEPLGIDFVCDREDVLLVPAGAETPPPICPSCGEDANACEGAVGQKTEPPGEGRAKTGIGRVAVESPWTCESCEADLHQFERPRRTEDDVWLCPTCYDDLDADGAVCCPVNDPSCTSGDDECHDACEAPAEPSAGQKIPPREGQA